MAKRDELAKAYKEGGGKGVIDIGGWEAFGKLNNPSRAPQLRAAGGGGAAGTKSTWNKSEYKDARATVTNAIGASIARNQFLTSLTRNPEAGLSIAKPEAALGRTAESIVTGAIRYLLPDATPEERKQKAVEINEDNMTNVGYWQTQMWDKVHKAFPNIRENSHAASVFQAQALNLAYVMAKELDDNGRLSDQDVQMAIKMLTGDIGSAEDIAALMSARNAQNEAKIYPIMQKALAGELDDGDKITPYKETALKWQKQQAANDEVVFNLLKKLEGNKQLLMSEEDLKNMGVDFSEGSAAQAVSDQTEPLPPKPEDAIDWPTAEDWRYMSPADRALWKDKK